MSRFCAFFNKERNRYCIYNFYWRHIFQASINLRDSICTVFSLSLIFATNRSTNQADFLGFQTLVSAGFGTYSAPFVPLSDGQVTQVLQRPRVTSLTLFNAISGQKWSGIIYAANIAPLFTAIVTGVGPWVAPPWKYPWVPKRWPYPGWGINAIAVHCVLI